MKMKENMHYKYLQTKNVMIFDMVFNVQMMFLNVVFRIMVMFLVVLMIQAATNAQLAGMLVWIAPDAF